MKKPKLTVRFANSGHAKLIEIRYGRKVWLGIYHPVFNPAENTEYVIKNIRKKYGKAVVEADLLKVQKQLLSKLTTMQAQWRILGDGVFDDR